MTGVSEPAAKRRVSILQGQMEPRFAQSILIWAGILFNVSFAGMLQTKL